MPSTIVIVDDDDAVRNSLVDYFEMEEYDVIAAENGINALNILDEIQPIINDETQPVIIILDVRLPDIDGLEVCKRIRQSYGRNVYIIMISGIKKETIDRILGLELGADVYKLKGSYESCELLAQVRVGERTLTPNNLPALDGWDYKDKYLRFNINRQQVQVRGNDVHLTSLEFRLLVYLYERAGIPCGRYDLLKYVWLYEKPDDVPMDHVVNTCIRRLREKIEPDPSNPMYILTIHTVGYKFK